MLIAVIGFAGSGKSEVARVLADEFGFRRFKFAAPLKAMAGAFLRSLGYCEDDIERFVEGDLKESLVPEAGVTSRFLQVDLGTRWGRGIHPDFWVWLGSSRLDDLAHCDVVVDDLRFPNEAGALRHRDGIVIRVDRPGAMPAAFKWGRLGRWLYQRGLMFGVHPSERVDRIRPDFVLNNTGTVRELHDEVQALVSALRRLETLPEWMQSCA